MAKNNRAALAAELDDEPVKERNVTNSKPYPVSGGQVLKEKVRLSVDIEPIPYRELVTFCQDWAFNLGRARINHVWVLREVIGVLLEDRALQAKVMERVAEKNPGKK